MPVTRATTSALRPFVAVEGCSPLPADAPVYVELGHSVCTAADLDPHRRHQRLEWSVTRQRSGVPSAKEDGYTVAVSLRFTNGNGELEDIAVPLFGGDGCAMPGLSTAEFRKFVAALNAAAATLPPTPRLLLEPMQ